MQTRLAVSLSALAMLAVGTAAAAPYSILDAFSDAARQINAKTSLHYTSVAVIVQSTNPSVRASEIAFTVHSKSGPQSITPGPGGLLSVAKNAALARENPDVTHNQPAGTVNIRLQPFVRAPAGQVTSLDVVAAMAREYEDVRWGSPLLSRTYKVPASAVRIVAKRGSQVSASTSCGVVFAPVTAGAVQAPLSEFPKGCALTIKGQAERAELVFVE